MGNTAGSRIVAISGPEKGGVFPLGPFDLIIGKGRSCGVRLADPLVSAKHCGLCHEGERPVIWDMGSAAGTYVNGFYCGGKILLDGDRIRVGRSIFVYLGRDDAELDPSMLERTPTELEWDRKLESGQRRAPYEAEVGAALDAFIDFNARINAARDTEEIQSRVFELLFRVIPVERAAILLAGRDAAGTFAASYRRIGSQNDEPFSLDESVTEKAWRNGEPVYAEKVVGFPLVTPGTKVGILHATIGANSSEWFTRGHHRLLEAITGSAAVALERAQYVAWLEGENRRLNEAANIEHGMVGRSEKMQQVYQLVGRAGASDRTVLITGESGTGKELVAKALHRNSPRSEKPFYVVNCSAFTDTLLGSELFGHERGAFTGADKQRIGLFELANGATVFLDEIGDCSMKLQAELLRVIQQGEFMRLGSSRMQKTNVRIIAATNVDLEKAINEGRFRQDLYFRLNVIRIQMPRLAARRDDIPLLMTSFMKKHGQIRSGPYPPVRGVTPEVRQIFMSYEWPGNVRELENAIESAIALGTSEYITREDLPPSLLGGSQPMGLSSWDKEVAACKKSIMERALRKTGGNRAEAGRLLGLHPTYFSKICKELDGG
jgi:DNA-binding NtrC family response regulator/pSer/pThr/pTyr-binding forkhead associated (FHA) protein